MMRKTILLAATTLLLALPVAATPAGPGQVFSDYLSSIVAFVEALLGDQPPESPEPDDGNGEIGLSIDPYG